MKNNKKWFFLGIAVLTMTLLTGGYAVSGLKKHMDRHGKGMVKEHVLSKVDYAMQELKLTADQQTKYSAIRTKMATSMDALMERHEKVHETLKADWQKPNPDVKAIALDIKKEINSLPNPITAQIDYMIEVYDILDANQQKQLVSMLKDHMDRKHGRHGWGDHHDDDD